MPYLLALVFFCVYTVYSVQRHRNLLTGGFDVGLFEQAVRGYAHFGAPIADLRGPGFNLLGDHFHPILALLAPIYRLFPSAVTLLVAQAALLASSIVPVSRLATRQAGRVAGVLIGVAYGLAWGIQEAVAFDFHEICFAVPLLAFSLERLVLQRWMAAALIAAPLVLVKEDLGVTVAAIGAVLFLRGQRRLGFGLAGFGLVATAVETLVLIPAANPADAYGFWGHMSDQGASESSTIVVLLGVLAHLLTPWVKIRTLLFVLAPTAFCALLSPLAIVAVPTLLWRFATNNPFYWVDTRHYNLVLMPIVFMALLDGLPRLLTSRWRPLRWAGKGVALATLVVALGLSVNRPFAGLVDGTVLQRNPAAAEVRALLDRIPSGTDVGASNRLAPHLTSRCTVRLLPDFHRAGLQPDWVVISMGGDWPLSPEEQELEIAALRDLGYVEEIRRPDLVMLRWPGAEPLSR